MEKEQFNCVNLLEFFFVVVDLGFFVGLFVCFLEIYKGLWALCEPDHLMQKAEAPFRF